MDKGYKGDRGTYGKQLKLVCQKCESRFEHPVFRLYCSPKCYTESSRRHQWTKEQEEEIIDLFGTTSPTHITEKIKKKYPQLTHRSVKEKVQALARKHGVKLKEQVDNFSYAEWAKLLDIDGDKFYRFISKAKAEGKVKPNKAGSRYLVSVKQMQRLALEFPSFFKGVKRENLEWFFDRDEERIDLVLSAKPWKEKNVKVYCVNNNTEYKSISCASTYLGINRNKIRRAATKGIPTCHNGVYYQFRLVS